MNHDIFYARGCDMRRSVGRLAWLALGLVAVEFFASLAARVGAGLTWKDCTAKVIAWASRRQAHTVSYSELCAEDVWFGVSKALVVWYDFQGRRCVKIVADGQELTLP